MRPTGAWKVDMDFTYKRRSSLGFRETVEAVEREIRARGFVLEAAYDLRAMLSAKGFVVQPLHVYEVTLQGEPAPQRAEQAFITQCRIHVYVEDDEVFVRVIRPTMMCRALDDGDTLNRAGEVESRVLGLVDAAAGGRAPTARSSSTSGTP